MKRTVVFLRYIILLVVLAIYSLISTSAGANLNAWLHEFSRLSNQKGIDDTHLADNLRFAQAHTNDIIFINKFPSQTQGEEVNLGVSDQVDEPLVTLTFTPTATLTFTPTATMTFTPTATMTFTPTATVTPVETLPPDLLPRIWLPIVITGS